MLGWGSWQRMLARLTLAEVTFSNNFVFFIHNQGAIWTNHNTGPASHAFVFVVDDFACFGVFFIAPDRQAVTQGASSQCRHWMANETGLLTSRLILAYGFGLFAVVCFDYVF